VVKIISKLAIKFTKVDDNNVEVLYVDGTTEILSLNNFNKILNNGKLKMGFVLPK